MRDYSKTLATRKETQERHSKMKCQTFEVKVVKSKMNCDQKNKINQLFKEAKWFKNAVISDLKTPTTAESVPVKVGKEFEDRKFVILAGAMKQSLKTDVKTSLKSLRTTKNKGEKVGELKHKSYCNQIGLKQFGSTFDIVDKNHIRLVNFSKPFYVKGLKQIPDKCEISNGKLYRKPDGLYFHITVFTEPDKPEIKNFDVGIDFGIRTNLTTDSGTRYNVSMPESKAILLASRKLSHCYEKNGKKKSNNYKKLQAKRRVAYQKLTNKKIDQANKIVHELLLNNDEIYIQDELLTKWQQDKYSSAKVQHSVMGTIKMKLKRSSKVFVIESSFPSTQVCPKCLNLTKHPVHKRAYDCAFCGYHHDDRDVKAAMCIKAYGKIKHLRSADVSLADLRAAGINFFQENSMLSSGEKSEFSEKMQEAQDFSRG